MTPRDRTGASATAEAGAASAAFELLASDTRLTILLALWEAYDPYAPHETVSFSRLQEMVGTRDSGQFNYHLRKLLETFVERAEDGYRLRPTGLELVQTVVAGAGEDHSLAPTEIDVDCPLCGAATTVSYESGWLYHRCTSCPGGFGQSGIHPEGILFGEPLPPAALRDRAPEQLFAMAVFQLLAVVSMKMAGVCPGCSGSMSTTVEICETHEHGAGAVCEACGNATPARVTWVCQVCKYRGSASPAGAVGLHPAVVSFYHDHGIEVGYPSADFASAREVLALLRAHEQAVVSTDPLRIAVTVRYGDDSLRLLLDGDLDVVEIDRSPGQEKH